MTGSILFQGAATPIGDFVGVGWGFFGLVPICVAPVMIDTGNRQVNYWAVGHGTCCTDVSDPNCGDWNRAVGGIKLEYTEFYPKLQDAVKHSKGRKGLLPRENAPYIIWGDPDEQFKVNILVLLILVLSSKGVFASKYCSVIGVLAGLFDSLMH